MKGKILEEMIVNKDRILRVKLLLPVAQMYKFTNKKQVQVALFCIEAF